MGCAVCSWKAVELARVNLYNRVMEEMLSNESAPSVTREEVVRLFKDNAHSEEAIAALQIWMAHEEARVSQENTSKATLRLNVSVAELYRDAGLTEEALEAFEQAAQQAWQEHEDDLYESLIAEADKLAQ